MDSVTTNETPEVKLHFLDYWRVIRLRRSLILVVFLLCVMTSTLLTIWLPKQYSSMVQIEVQKDDPEVDVAQTHQSGSGTDPYFLTTQFKIIESYRILTNVIANLKLDEKLPLQNGETRWGIDQTYDYLTHRISVEQTRMTSLIEISVRNQDSKMAAAIANQVAESYKEFRVEQWKNSRLRGIQALELKQTSMTNDLQEAQAKLDSLRTNLDIVDMYDQSAISLDLLSKRLEDWDHQRVMAEADYMEYSNILYNLNAIDPKQLGGALTEAYAHQSDQELMDLASRLEVAKARMTEVKQSLGDEMPAFKSVKKQLEDCEAAYSNKVAAVMAGIKTRVNEDKGFLQLIRQEEDEITKSKNEQAQKDRPYYNAKAEVELKRRNCDQLAGILIREVAEAGQPNDSVVIICNPARPDKIPVSPRSMLIIPLGIIVGLMVGMGLAFFIEYLDTSVKTIDDVERSLQAPVLGVISQNVGLILDEGAESPHAEAYRVLRTNLLFSRKNDGWNTISVMSSGAGEGKSTTLFNLATVFAQNGQRILVVDSDLRRPTLHKLLHVSNTVGLTDFLLKQRPLEEVIQKTKVPTLDFMASGKLPSSSMSILGSAQMKETISELKHRYEFIFFDSPPLLGVSDGSILASEMDMVLQVIQYRRYPQAMTLRGKQMILKVGGNLIGIVLNNINMTQDENYYYYSGYYEYQSHQKDDKKDDNVVQGSEANKMANVEIKPKY
ncbi:MAG TPA: polysaccharide biosynthesis tyrosine autokinase [Verrucomicrobiae bacterium]|jgi:capsular exopolysaccharide synthesis family protein|nr:polysaccharide biosynthesis tyrosine autokinase [Verrucomicrobiae bacterium]